MHIPIYIHPYIFKLYAHPYIHTLNNEENVLTKSDLYCYIDDEKVARKARFPQFKTIIYTRLVIVGIAVVVVDSKSLLLLLLLLNRVYFYKASALFFCCFLNTSDW